MTSKKISKAKRQIGDQTTKGGLIGIMIYALSTNNVDPVLIGLLVPVASSVLAWISTKIGDPDLACLFIPNDDDQKKIDPTVHGQQTASRNSTASRHGHMGQIMLQTFRRVTME
jgi:hypothetical protein